MRGRQDKRWRRLALGWLAVPAFAAFYLLAPDPNAEALRLFPVEAATGLVSVVALDEVMRLPDSAWKPMPSLAVKPKSLKHQELWARVRIPQTEATTPRRLTAEVGVTLLSEVDFYLVGGGKVLQHAQMGLDRPETLPNRSSISHDFNFTSSKEIDQTLYIRVNSSGFIIAPISVRDEGAFNRFASLRNIIVHFFLGVAWGLALYNIVVLVFLRKPHQLYFVIAIMSITVLASIINGLLRDMQFDWNHAKQTRISSIVTMCGLFFLILFGKSFLNAPQNLPRLSRRINVIVALIIFAVILSPLIPPPVLAFSVIAMIMIAFVDLTLQTLPYEMLPSVFYLNLAIRGLFFGAVVSLGTWLALAPGNMITSRAIILGVIWCILFSSVATVARMRELEKGNKLVADTMRGVGPKSRLNAMLRDSYLNQFSASEISVTIMFIDIVAFARFAEKRDEQTVFRILATRMDDIINIVYKHGGSVDRSLGDGVLCFFGYDSKKLGNQHARNAFAAACEIQRSTLSAFERRDSDVIDEYFPLPVRIGLHTDLVTIGNLGSQDLVDFTMVGNGVNFASRLETACSPFKIMLSDNTRDNLIRDGLAKDEFLPVKIAVKHTPELVAAYEFDPEGGRGDRLFKAINDFHQAIEPKVRRQRFRLNSNQSVSIHSVYGDYRVLDVSLEGFQLEGTVYLAQNAQLSVRIQTQDENANKKLQSMLLDEFTIVIRWSRKFGNSFTHGAQIVGGHLDQHQMLLDTLLNLSATQAPIADGEGQNHHVA